MTARDHLRIYFAINCIGSEMSWSLENFERSIFKAQSPNLKTKGQVAEYVVVEQMFYIIEMAYEQT